MPCTGIHLLIAHMIKPDANELYWIGNFAPDYTNDRELKDKIHLRDSFDRWNSLKKLYQNNDMDNDFNIGWFLHLFVDTCWDEIQINDHKKWFNTLNTGDNWFLCYREEIGVVSYYLYHNLPWSKSIWDIIKNAQIHKIKTSFPISISEIESYRDRIVYKHSESNNNQNPSFFAFDKIIDFSNTTVNKYKNWIETLSKIN